MRPPLPFPLPLHVGTDICSISRIRLLLQSQHCRRFVRRVLTPEELPRAHFTVHRAIKVGSEKAIGAAIAKAFVKDGARDGAEDEVDPDSDEAEERAYVMRRAAGFLAGR